MTDRPSGQPVIGRRVFRFDTVTSTNDKARELALKLADEGTVVTAAEQTVGRGARGRSWVSPKGANLLFSVILRPDVLPDRVSELAFVASVAVTRRLIDGLGLPARVKWPNDIRVGGRKIAGILIEVVAGGQPQASAAIVGIGVNMNWRDLPAELADCATSVLLETGQEVNLETELRGLLDSLNEVYLRYQTDGFAQILAQWKSLECTTGSEVTVALVGDEVQGVAESVDDEGALMVRLLDGVLRRVPAAGLIVDQQYASEEEARR